MGDEITEQKRHEMLKAVIMLWLGGFLVGIAIAIFVFHGFHATPVLFAGCGGVLSGLGLMTIFQKLDLALYRRKASSRPYHPQDAFAPNIGLIHPISTVDGSSMARHAIVLQSTQRVAPEYFVCSGSKLPVAVTRATGSLARLPLH